MRGIYHENCTVFSDGCCKGQTQHCLPMPSLQLLTKNAVSLAQTTVTMFVSKSQIRRKETCTMRTSREMPNQLAIGLAIRQAIRSKKVINMLHGFGVLGSLELRPTELKTICCPNGCCDLGLISWRCRLWWLMDT